jgi:AcrR family transcriptional regulator
MSAPAARADGASARGRPRSEAAEEAILRAALELLDQVGYEALSIEAVASRARVGRPTIYRRWPSKLDLAVEAVVRLAPPLKITESDDALADLRYVVGELLPDMSGSAAGRVIIALVGDPAVHARLAPRIDERYLQPRRAVLAGLLRRAVRAGQVRPDVDPDLLIGLIMGAATDRWLVTGRPVTRESARHIVDAVLGLAAPRP